MSDEKKTVPSSSRCSRPNSPPSSSRKPSSVSSSGGKPTGLQKHTATCRCVVCFHNKLPGPIPGSSGSGSGSAAGVLLSLGSPRPQSSVSPSVGVTEADYKASEEHWDLCLYYNSLLEQRTPQTFEFDCVCEDLEETVENGISQNLQESDSDGECEPCS